MEFDDKIVELEVKVDQIILQGGTGQKISLT